MLLGGTPIFLKAYVSIKSWTLNMYSLITLGVLITYFYSVIIYCISLIFKINHPEFLHIHFSAASIIITLALTGKFLQTKSIYKTNKEILSLINLIPQNATLINKKGKEQKINLCCIKIGDQLKIGHGENIPVDGIVLYGKGYVDTSMFTGEFFPKKKQIGDYIIGSTLNKNGSFIMYAKKNNKDSLISHIINHVKKVQKTKIQNLSDKVSAIFIPTILLISITSFLVWFFIGPEPNLTNGLIHLITVLIIACPCSLGLATPLSITVGIGLGARHGILFKNAKILELLNQITTVLIDKTGTLTQGNLILEKIIIRKKSTFKNAEILNLAANLEKNSQHPLSTAIIKKTKMQKFIKIQANNFLFFPGKGISGNINNKKILIGNQSLMQQFYISNINLEKIAKKYQIQGATSLFIAINNMLEAIFIIRDQIKKEAKEAMLSLKNIGIDTIMLTGDSKKTAIFIAKKLSIQKIFPEASPVNKSKFIDLLQKKGIKVAMVGDGINDAPALYKANIGIAMGNGNNIAIQNASIILLHNNLNTIKEAIMLSSNVLLNIKNNLFFAFTYNTISISLAAGLFSPIFHLSINPIIASLFMSLSSITVILNSLRIKIK